MAETSSAKVVEVRIYRLGDAETGALAERDFRLTLPSLFKNCNGRSFEIYVCPHLFPRLTVRICGVWELRKDQGFRDSLVHVGNHVRSMLGDEDIQFDDVESHRCLLSGKRGEPLRLSTSRIH